MALRDGRVTVAPGEVVAVLGPNGAGKTTLLRAVTGLLGMHGGRITAGTVRLDGEPVAGDGAGRGRTATWLVRRGVAHVMEGRRLFPGLSVADNLRAGGFTLRRRAAVDAAVERALEAFPVLRGRLSEPAGQLSGGQQQLAAIARALVPGPRLLLLDEPSLGLSPLAVQDTAAALRAASEAGTAVVLVEQQAGLALSLSSRAFLLDRGAVVREGASADLRDDPSLAAAYFGGGVDHP